MQLDGATELEKRIYQACLLNEKNPASEEQTAVAIALSDAGTELQRLRAARRTHVWCNSCQAVRPIVFAEMGGNDTTGVFSRPIDILCHECHFAIATMYDVAAPMPTSAE